MQTKLFLQKLPKMPHPRTRHLRTRLPTQTQVQVLEFGFLQIFKESLHMDMQTPKSDTPNSQTEKRPRWKSLKYYQKLLVQIQVGYSIIVLKKISVSQFAVVVSLFCDADASRMYCQLNCIPLQLIVILPLFYVGLGSIVICIYIYLDIYICETT